MSQLENASRSLIEEHQLARLQLGLSRIFPHNRFYEEKLFSNRASLSLGSLDDLSSFPGYQGSSKVFQWFQMSDADEYIH